MITLAESTGGFMDFMQNQMMQFLHYTAFANFEIGHLVMILIGLVFITLAITKEFEPLLLIPIGFGMIIGNIPFFPGLKTGIYETSSVLNILYHGVQNGWYPPLIFLGIGAMTDFSALLSNPKLMLIGAAAQVGIFAAYMASLALGFTPAEAGAIGIIGGADGPTAIFISSQLAPDLMGAIAVSAYSYMALVPVIQPPIMRLFTTKKERVIRMKPPRTGSAVHLLCGAHGLAAAGYAVLRQLAERERRYPPFGQHSLGSHHRHRYNPYRFDGGCFHTGYQVPHTQVDTYFRPWRHLVHRCHDVRCAVCEVHEPVPEGRQQDQPAYRKLRC